ncbi:histidinol dehydrogenase [Opitutus sp. GAS368]|jgi:histidinol dehydrogenase|uniref:histidinol dehydrogenase n=1 Tax=Opitutus sp. GAS368 TaxID=1882749 RepID=UPI00087B812D|nr:histidinol dehydrogenase [Opitutus sp. GAS368]SDR98176.1 histidinol dehydrogenase [Opitutus sp. GAS368]
MKPLIWKKLSASRQTAALRRPAQSAQPAVAAAVRTIVAAVRRDGDAALRRLTEKFDRVTLRSLRVSAAEFATAEKSLTRADLAALRTAYRNIRAFHAAQQPRALRIETQPGIVCEKTVRPVGRVGLYVPGGSAPLPSTALMLGVPSQLAGNPVRVLCTPPDKNGRINPWILCAARFCGITEVYKVGGAQAIAALAYGTASIPKCDKLFGPGNAFVTEAKQQVARDAAGAAIDLPAGPSEVLVIADHRANPAFVAADLLSQAEHGPDSQVVLVAFSEKFAARVQAALARQLSTLPRAAIARRALARSRIFVAANRAEAVVIANAYAPEHLILQVADPRALLASVTTAGSVFLGDLTPESLGDYASGTNHVLPTYGWARACSGLGLADFQRTMTVQTASQAGLQRLGPVVERLALAEGLAAHQRAVRVRLDDISVAAVYDRRKNNRRRS